MTTYGPYTPVRKAGSYYYTSGQVGIDPKSKTAASDVTAQTTQALANLKITLQEAGVDMNDVVKTTVFLTDMNDFAAMNAAYENMFEAPRPARSTVAVQELPRVAGDTRILVEVDAVAYKEDV